MTLHGCSSQYCRTSTQDCTEVGSHLVSAFQDVVGVSNHARHFLLLHQQRLGELPVDVIKDKPLPPQIVNASAQHLVARLGLIVLVVHFLQSVLKDADLLLCLHDKAWGSVFAAPLSEMSRLAMAFPWVF